MTKTQRFAYESMLPQYGIEYSNQLIDFSQIFANNNPVVLEIGFGMGASLAEQANNNPNINFLGIEVHKPGMGALLAKMQEEKIYNIRVICHDAVEVLQQMLNNQSLQKVQLFFPDPWHKTRHHKRRIVQSEFVQLLQTKLKPGGIFHMATDWQDYAKYMLKIMTAEKNWKNHSTDNTYVPKPEDRPVTKFQKRGERLGHGVWDLVFEKRSDL